MSKHDCLEYMRDGDGDQPATSVRDRYDAAVAALTRQGIPVHLDTKELSAGDAWCKHTDGTDGRAAIAWEPGGF